MEKKCMNDDGRELARAYVPFQEMNEIYSSAEALKYGTVFPELNRPYHRCTPADNKHNHKETKKWGKHMPFEL